MLNYVVPVGFNDFLLSYCEHVLYATKNFRLQDIRSDVQKSRGKLHKLFILNVFILYS